MLFFRMLLGFSPWIAFLIIAPGSMFRLKLGILVASALAAGLALARLNRGVIMWAGLLFFAYDIVAVNLLGDMWTVRHMAVLANGALALAAWAGIILRRPFPLEYAQDANAPDRAHGPWFVRVNYLLAFLWAVVFSANTWLALLRMTQPEMPAEALRSFSRGLQLSATLLSICLPLVLRLRRKAQAAETD